MVKNTRPPLDRLSFSTTGILSIVLTTVILTTGVALQGSGLHASAFTDLVGSFFMPLTAPATTTTLQLSTETVSQPSAGTVMLPPTMNNDSGIFAPSYFINTTTTTNIDHPAAQDNLPVMNPPPPETGIPTNFVPVSTTTEPELPAPPTTPQVPAPPAPSNPTPPAAPSCGGVGSLCGYGFTRGCCPNTRCDGDRCVACIGPDGRCNIDGATGPCCTGTCQQQAYTGPHINAGLCPAATSPPPRPPPSCLREGDPCLGGARGLCCSGMTCTAGRCRVPPPPPPACAQRDGTCGAGRPCCTGNACIRGTCYRISPTGPGTGTCGNANNYCMQRPCCTGLVCVDGLDQYAPVCASPTDTSRPPLPPPPTPPATCGTDGLSCCIPSYSCAAGFLCNGDFTCEACGAGGQRCCDGDIRTCSQDGTVCGYGQPAERRCEPCGGDNQLCCSLNLGAAAPGVGTCTDAALECRGSYCRPPITCGTRGLACCATGTACQGALECNGANVCEYPCGTEGITCCNWSPTNLGTCVNPANNPMQLKCVGSPGNPLTPATCQACGGLYQGCCANDGCRTTPTAPLDCRGGTCRPPCGRETEACCPTVQGFPGTCEATNPNSQPLGCSGNNPGTCVQCGNVVGAPCCPGTGCSNNLSLRCGSPWTPPGAQRAPDRCLHCGAVNELCCAGNSCPHGDGVTLYCEQETQVCRAPAPPSSTAPASSTQASVSRPSSSAPSVPPPDSVPICGRSIPNSTDANACNSGTCADGRLCRGGVFENCTFNWGVVWWCYRYVTCGCFTTNDAVPCESRNETDCRGSNGDGRAPDCTAEGSSCRRGTFGFGCSCQSR